MIRLLVDKQTEEGWYINICFNYFNDHLVPTYYMGTHKTKESAHSFYHSCKRDTLLVCFEKYIFCQEKFPDPTDANKKAQERCINANRYFNETKELTLYKICEMITKIQKELLSLLNTKHERYEQHFGWFNELIKFCKAEIESQLNDAAKTA